MVVCMDQAILNINLNICLLKEKRCYFSFLMQGKLILHTTHLVFLFCKLLL